MGLDYRDVEEVHCRSDFFSAVWPPGLHRSQSKKMGGVPQGSISSMYCDNW